MVCQGINHSEVKEYELRKQTYKMSLETQRDALLNFFEALNGGNWKTNTSWGSPSLQDWFGITLDENGYIVEINLIDNNLVGNIPESLFNLNSLKVIKLTSNKISTLRKVITKQICSSQRFSIFLTNVTFFTSRFLFESLKEDGTLSKRILVRIAINIFF